MQHEDWWYPWSPVKFRKDTMHLTDDAELIYRRLIDYYMETGGPIPDNDIVLAKAASVSIERWKMAAAMLRPYFCHDQGNLRNKKCDEVLAEQRAFQAKQAEKGRAGAAARWGKTTENKEKNSSGHATAIAQAMPNDATIHNTTIKVNNKTPKPPLGENGVGVLKNNGKEGYDILRHLKDDDLTKARHASPGWDIYHLASVYNDSVRSGKREPPYSPAKAFIAWLPHYTKGQSP